MRIVCSGSLVLLALIPKLTNQLDQHETCAEVVELAMELVHVLSTKSLTLLHNKSVDDECLFHMQDMRSKEKRDSDLSFMTFSETGTMNSKQYYLTPDTYVDLLSSSLRFDSKVLAYSLQENFLKVQEVYTTPTSGTMIRNHFGTYYPANKTFHQTLLGPRHMHGDRLRTGFVPSSPGFYVASNGTVLGYYADVMKLLSEKLNFTVDYQRDPNGIWGVQDDSGKWLGLVGSLEQGLLDIGVALSMTLDRKEVIGFSSHVLSRPRVLIGHASSLKMAISIGHYYQVFSDKVWLSMLITLPLIAISLCFSGRLSETNSSLSYTTCIEAVFLLLAQKDAFEIGNRRRLSITVGYFTACAFCNLLFIFYSALLTAFMVTSPKEINIGNMGDLAESDLNLYVLKGAVMLSELKNAPLNTPFHKAYVSKVEGNDKALINTFEEGFEKIAKDPKGLMYGMPEMLDFCPDCYIVKSFKGITLTTNLGVIKDSPIKKALNEEIEHLRMSGVLDRLGKRYGLSGREELLLSDDSMATLGYEIVLTPFAALLVGCLASVLCFTAEKLKTKSQELQSQK